MNKRLLFSVLAVSAALLSRPAAQGQPSPQTPSPVPKAPEPNVEVDPIRCWWRTSAGAVRIGQNFTVTLTCAVLQTDAVQVVPDESRLDSAVIQMTPFEILGGTHPMDLYSGNRRFFQYEYVLRVISPDVIGKDVKIPDPPIHYRINSTVTANSAVQGRDHSYVLAPLSIRVLSLVPADASDIRDTMKEGFSTAEQLAFRANVFQIVGTTAFVLSGLVAALGVITLLMRARKKKSTVKRGLSEAAILRRAARELAAVQSDAGRQGWDEDLVGRAVAATRIAATSAIGRPIDQRKRAHAKGGEGRLVVGGSRLRKRTIVSGAATSEDLSRAIARLPESASAERRQMLDELQQALSAFTKVQYAQQASFDQTSLDEALRHAITGTRRLMSYQAWPKPYFRSWLLRAEAQQA